MSDVQRFWCHEASNIRCVRESDYDAALAQVAALREELATQRESKEQWEKVAADWVMKAQAAEQRNAAVPTISDEQYEELNDFFLSVCCGDLHRLDKPMIASLCEVGALESCGFGKHRLTKFGEYLLENKPTESGASE